MSAAMMPLPSLIRASAWDAANSRMRKGGRKTWSRGDYNAACDTQERLTRACYGRAGEDVTSNWCYIRFQIAERMEKGGLFRLDSDFDEVSATIDEIIAAPMSAAP